jgi:hypothetical protein
MVVEQERHERADGHPHRRGSNVAPGRGALAGVACADPRASISIEDLLRTRSGLQFSEEYFASRPM